MAHCALIRDEAQTRPPGCVAGSAVQLTGNPCHLGTREPDRRAGELPGARGRSGHRRAIDALVAATASGLPRPVVLPVSDSEDLCALAEEPHCPARERIVVLRV